MNQKYMNWSIVIELNPKSNSLNFPRLLNNAESIDENWLLFKSKDFKLVNLSNIVDGKELNLLYEISSDSNKFKLLNIEASSWGRKLLLITNLVNFVKFAECCWRYCCQIVVA